MKEEVKKMSGLKVTMMKASGKRWRQEPGCSPPRRGFTFAIINMPVAWRIPIRLDGNRSAFYLVRYGPNFLQDRLLITFPRERSGEVVTCTKYFLFGQGGVFMPTPLALG